MRLASLLATMSVAAVASAAPTKQQCVDADTWGQSHRQEGHLHAARADFRACLDPSCPAVVRSDCKMRLDEVDAAMPTVVIDAPVDFATAKVTMDDAPLAVGADPIAVDPGAHHFVLLVPGHAPVTRDAVVREGEKAQRVIFDRPTATVVVHHAETSSSGLAPARIAGIVIGVVGLAGVGVGAAFGIASFGAWATAKSDCSTPASCDLSRALPERQHAYDLAAVSDVAFVVGGVLAAAGVALVVLGGRAQPIASRDAAGLAFTRTF